MRAAFKEFGSSPPGLPAALPQRGAARPGTGLLGGRRGGRCGGRRGAAGRDVEAERELLLQVASAMEGHADNAAASLLGGFVVAWKFDGNNGDAYGAARLEPHAELRPVALIATENPPPRRPGGCSRKGSAGRRGVHRQPDSVGSLRLHRAPELLFAATEDRLHQPYRRPAYPASASLVDRLRERGIPAVISGAGPTVLALPTDGVVPEDLLDPSFTATPLPVDRDGAVVHTG